MPADLNGRRETSFTPLYPRYSLISHVRLINPIARTSDDCDILLEWTSPSSIGRIAAIGPNLDPQVFAPLTRIRGSGLYACRSFVDLHTHICEPGAMHKEDIRTATAAAAAGGYGDILAIPSIPSAWQEQQTLDYIYSNAAANSKVALKAAAYLTTGNLGRELCDAEALLQNGAVAFYEEGNASPALLYTAMERLRKLNALLILRPQVPALDSDTDKRSSVAAEAAAVASALAMAEVTGCRLHLTLISTAVSLQLIREAKARGVRVTCDTAPQYFTLTHTDLLYYGTLAKVSPPLRTASDREAIIEALADGTVDCIVSDHTPETAAGKRKPPADAPAGMIGLQTAFSLGMRELVLTGRIDLYRLIELLSTAPARILGLPERLSKGSPAKVILLDLGREYTLTEGILDSKSKNCPWVGQSFQGIVKRNFARIHER